MKHSIEITEQVFKQLVTGGEVISEVENTELATLTYYNVLGVNLLQINNFVSCVTQYYMQDINA